MRADGPAPSLTVRNTGVPFMSETVAVTRSGDSLTFTWSWGAQIGDISRPDSAAQAVAYVLAADGAQLGMTR